MVSKRKNRNAPLPAMGANLAKFKEWLSAQGAVELQPTNPYEKARYSIAQGHLILYEGSRRGRHWYASLGGDTLEKIRRAYNDRNKKGRGQIGQEVINASNKVKRQSRPKDERLRILKHLLRTQEDECFFCGLELELEPPEDTPKEDRPSIEHLVPLALGGPDTEANMVAACLGCNTDVGHMTVYEKIMYRDSFFEDGD